MWVVVWLAEAEQERQELPVAEMNAVDRAADKLEAFGPKLPYPHQSNVQGTTGLRELRPRAGRSPWRAFYARSGDTFLIGAIGPEAKVSPQGFKRAVRAAQTRLNNYNAER